MAESGACALGISIGPIGWACLVAGGVIVLGVAAHMKLSRKSMETRTMEGDLVVNRTQTQLCTVYRD